MSVQADPVALVVSARVGKDHPVTNTEAVADLDQIDRTATELHRNARGDTIGIDLEQAHFGIRLAKGRMRGK